MDWSSDLVSGRRFGASTSLNSNVPSIVLALANQDSGIFILNDETYLAISPLHRGALSICLRYTSTTTTFLQKSLMLMAFAFIRRP